MKLSAGKIAVGAIVIGAALLLGRGSGPSGSSQPSAVIPQPRKEAKHGTPAKKAPLAGVLNQLEKQSGGPAGTQSRAKPGGPPSAEAVSTIQSIKMLKGAIRQSVFGVNSEKSRLQQSERNYSEQLERIEASGKARPGWTGNTRAYIASLAQKHMASLDQQLSLLRSYESMLDTCRSQLEIVSKSDASASAVNRACQGKIQPLPDALKKVDENTRSIRASWEKDRNEVDKLIKPILQRMR